MLESLLEYLNTLITPLGFRAHGLTHLIDKGDIAFPAVYSKRGEYDPLNAEQPIVYHRILDGPNDTDDPDDESPVNNTIVTRTYSMRCVAVFPFDLYGEDDQYQEDKVIRNLNSQIKHRNIRTLKSSLQLFEVSAQPSRSSRGPEAWGEEFAGIEWTGKRRIVYVDYEAVFRGFEDCITAQGCGEGDIDVTQAIIDDICPDGDPASITTNGDSPALEVASGASQDIAVHNSAGADVGSRSGSTVTVADGTVTVNGAGSIAAVAEGTTNVNVENSAAADIGSLSGSTVTIEDMTLDFPDSTTEPLVIVPGDTVTIDPEFVFIPESGASSGSFITPALDATFSVSAQSIDGGGSISNIVIDGAGAVATFVGASFSSSVVVTFDITGTVNSVTLTF